VLDLRVCCGSGSRAPTHRSAELTALGYNSSPARRRGGRAWVVIPMVAELRAGDTFFVALAQRRGDRAVAALYGEPGSNPTQ